MSRVTGRGVALLLFGLAGYLSTPSRAVSVALALGEAGQQETPGLRLELNEAAEPGWSCPGLAKHLAGAKQRIWLVWLQMREPREFPGYTAVHQAEVWSKWRRGVTVEFTVCPPGTLPPETAKDCLSTPQEMAIVEQGIDWLITRSAMESVIASRGPLIPEECRRNHYRLRAVFDPVPLGRPETIARIVGALKDADPRVRALAAETLGKLGREGDDEVAAALRMARKDKDPSVSKAAKAALEQLRQR